MPECRGVCPLQPVSGTRGGGNTEKVPLSESNLGALQTKAGPRRRQIRARTRGPGRIVSRTAGPAHGADANVRLPSTTARPLHESVPTGVKVSCPPLLCQVYVATVLHAYGPDSPVAKLSRLPLT